MHRYLHIKTRNTWWDAKYECEKLGAYLVTIGTEEENSWLRETFLPVWDPATCNPWWDCCSHWTGANDIEEEGRFVWTENDNRVTSYFNWHPDEPDNSGEQDCVLMCRDGIWGTTQCHQMYSYICEKD
ncbi:perlucin-like protein [Saccostrea cucullata]|uniref:perlucin-like protein n=1 Tax=Saccostrea cuccullata TaxID=36930 RepID=UPI002ED08779